MAAGLREVMPREGVLGIRLGRPVEALGRLDEVPLPVETDPRLEMDPRQPLRIARRRVDLDAGELLVELPPLRIPVFSNVFIKTMARLEWYLREVVPFSSPVR